MHASWFNPVRTTASLAGLGLTLACAGESPATSDPSAGGEFGSGGRGGSTAEQGAAGGSTPNAGAAGNSAPNAGADGASAPNAGAAGDSAPNAGSAGADAVGAAGTSEGQGGTTEDVGQAGTMEEGQAGVSSNESGAPNARPFLLGADISSVPEAMDQGTTYVDTDGARKPLVELLKNHGFNAIRLRTFVAPGAPYGYAFGTGGSCEKAEAYNDRAHLIEFAQVVKASGMKLLVDFHYSDTWADPGKQIIPEPWRNAETVEELAQYVRTYTTETLLALADAGASPEMVQVGNETTPGMLIHIPTAETDCWGNGATVNPRGIGGQASNQNWDNLATLLSAGTDAVRAVDPGIEIMLHIENTDDLAGVRWWVDSALSRGVDFDVLGLSAYTAFQGPPSVWEDTLTNLATEFPNLDFVIAEYNPDRTAANEIIAALPDGRGRGTFFWEPTQSGSWGESLFSQTGTTLQALPDAFAEYDALRITLGL